MMSIHFCNGINDFCKIMSGVFVIFMVTCFTAFTKATDSFTITLRKQADLNVLKILPPKN